MISGDLDADISDASLGAYFLLVSTAAPQVAGAALDLLRSTYPALAGLDFVELVDSTSNSYVFEFMRVNERVEPGSLEIKAALQEFLAGTTKQGPATIVWVVVANGNLATALQWP